MHTIAVIEDDPSMLQGLNRLLSAHGFRVQRFTSAESFLDDIATCEAKLTSSGSDLPVIFMTAIDNKATRQEAFEVGCVAYLRKPFLAKLLIDAINGIA
jgi:FixJ family two-component response regulator